MNRARVLGRDLRPGMALPLVSGGSVSIVAVRPHVVPAAVLHDSVAARYPGGMPGRLVDTAPSCHGFTAFDDDYYEVFVLA